mgnify:CR=1 FL=1
MVKKLILGSLLAIAITAIAQTTLIQGRDSAGKLWPINVDVVNNQARVGVATTDFTCGGPTHTVVSVGTTAADVPGTQLANRRFVVICVSNAETAAVIVKCRVDGTAPTSGETGAGDVIRNGDCVTYAIASATVPSCISDTATTAVTTFQCT